MNNFEYTPPKNEPVTTEELQNDIKRVAEKLNTNILTQKLYSEHGKYDVTNLSRRFGTWNKALAKVGLKPGNINNYSDEELFENILSIWQHKGKQPTRRDLSVNPSKISQSPYNRRFKTWTNALQCFVDYVNEEEIEKPAEKEISNKNGLHKTGRDPSLRLRYKVLVRDHFACKQCGASPAKDPSIQLHIDHITAWSKEGETILENLQTLCSDCNLGKSNLE